MNSGGGIYDSTLFLVSAKQALPIKSGEDEQAGTLWRTVGGHFRVRVRDSGALQIASANNWLHGGPVCGLCAGRDSALILGWEIKPRLQAAGSKRFECRTPNAFSLMMMAGRGILSSAITTLLPRQRRRDLLVARLDLIRTHF